ncbi:MAG: hydroxymethylglutaryl-CoA lyase [Alphaproteobacteria bacterium]|nr:hydroxymethylglutaryl-CoA lyase [Alphaproteobacteria bacterium]
MKGELVELVEVGPRDGLQNEPLPIPAEDKIRLVDRLSEAGFSRIEVTSFVSPKWVPQMADAATVMAGIRRKKSIRYSVLTPNLQGFENALSAGADEVAIFGSASEGFSQKNINCSIAESLKRFSPVTKAAAEHDIPVRGYISCVIACPYDGKTTPETVANVAETLLEMGCYEISLGDTIGAGTPQDIAAMLDCVVPRLGASFLAGHYHDTGGQALVNIDTSLEYGLRRFDSAVGGLGGCPYAPGARGNVSTRMLACHLEDTGWTTGLDLDLLAEIEVFIRTLGIRDKDEGNG